MSSAHFIDFTILRNVLEQLTIVYSDFVKVKVYYVFLTPALLAYFFFLIDPYSVKRNVARTLNSQLVYEYILHCLRATYKYFALPHKKNAQLSKKSSPDACEEKSEMLDHGKTIKHENSELQDLDGRTNTAVVEDCIMETTVISPAYRTDASKLCDGSESFTEEELADDTSHLGIAHEDSDCIIEEVISGDNEDFKPSCEETESGNEDDEEEHKQQKRRWNILTTEQGIDEDSDSGDLPVTVNERDIDTYSTSDPEGFQNAALTESDEFGLDCSVVTDDKIDVDEESTEGSDELEESPKIFMCSAQRQMSQIINSDYEEEEEEEQSVLNQSESGLVTTSDELGNAYTGSGDDDALSEEGDDFSISNNYNNKHFKDNADGLLRINLYQEGHTEKRGLSEENTAVEECLQSELFYEFSKTAFTKGKVSKLSEHKHIAYVLLSVI